MDRPGIGDWMRTGDRVRRGVVAVTLAALVARLVGLGGRIAHFDEGRVAYWGLHFLDTGTFEYRYIVHGPLVQHVDRALFALVGAGDATARLPVAVFGGLLPLAALLFRDRLRDAEVVAVSLFLAFNPVLVYYSRFLRSTVLVAGFMFVAFGLFLRAYDTRRPRYLYAGAAVAALGFTAKENALIYLLTWAGAFALVADGLLFAPDDHDSGIDRLRSITDRRAGALRRSAASRRAAGWWAAHAGGATLLAAAVVLYLYAPRGDGGVGLWAAVLDPARMPDLIGTTAADIQRGLEYWFGTPTRGDDPLGSIQDAFGRELRTLRDYAAPLCAFALAGIGIERYAGDRRPLVLFAAFWGLASVVGYPIGTDIPSAWIAVNGIVPLTIPAAVGVGWLYREGRDAVRDRDRIATATVGLLVLLAVGQVGWATATAVYGGPADYDLNDDGEHDNELVQYAQPADDFQPARRHLAVLARTNDGVDVLFHGTEFVAERPTQPLDPPCLYEGRALPLQWYVALHDADAACSRTKGELDEAVASDPPPVVITRERNEEAVDDRVDGYVSYTYELRAWGTETTVFVDADRLPGA